MKVLWTPRAKEEYLYWSTTNQKVLGIINDLIADVKRTPFKGLGKSEPLKYRLKGWWSRRITREDRLVYRITGSGDNKQIEIAQCRYHY